MVTYNCNTRAQPPGRIPDDVDAITEEHLHDECDNGSHDWRVDWTDTRIPGNEQVPKASRERVERIRSVHYGLSGLEGQYEVHCKEALDTKIAQKNLTYRGL